MTPIPLSRGHCLLCRDRFRKAQMVDHVAACPRWEVGPQRRVVLLVEGTPPARHWFLLAADVTATLQELARFLQESILKSPQVEDIGAFRTLHRRRVFRSGAAELGSGTESLNARLDTLIEPGLRLWYDVDADVSLALRVLVERKGLATGERIILLAQAD